MTSKQRLVPIAVVTIAALAAWSALAGAPPSQKTPAPSGGTQGGGLDGTGVVAYDPPGDPDEFVGNYGQFVGNVFDTRVGNPLETGNVTQLAAFWGAAGATFPGFGIFTAANNVTLDFQFVPGVVPFTFNTIPVTGVNNAAPGFLAGVFVSSAFTSSADSVGAQSQSTMGQGFHAAGFGYGDGNITPIANRNAMVRVAGSIWVVPVELMSFDVQ